MDLNDYILNGETAEETEARRRNTFGVVCRHWRMVSEDIEGPISDSRDGAVQSWHESFLSNLTLGGEDPEDLPDIAKAVEIDGAILLAGESGAALRHAIWAHFGCGDSVRYGGAGWVFPVPWDEGDARVPGTSSDLESELPAALRVED